MNKVDHEFGSQTTELKLSVVEAYLRAFTTALRRKFPELWYIDAFAGTGQRTERIPARRGGLLEPAPAGIVRKRGSAKIAIDVNPPFDRLIFVEKRPRAVEALRGLRKMHPDRNISVIAGDANVEIPRLISSVNWQRVRAVMFLDPYGMSVGWETLRAIARTGAIDVWFLSFHSRVSTDRPRAAPMRLTPTSVRRSPVFLGRARGNMNCTLLGRAVCFLKRLH